MAKQVEVVIEDESFVDAFCSNTDDALNWATRTLAAAGGKYKSDIPDSNVVNAEATLVKDRLIRDGFKGSTLRNKPSVARKILRNHPVLSATLPQVLKSKAWKRPDRCREGGIDQQSFEKLVTCAETYRKDNDRQASQKTLFAAFKAKMDAPPTSKTPTQKAAAGLKQLLGSGCRSKAWKAVMDAARTAAEAEGIDLS